MYANKVTNTVIPVKENKQLFYSQFVIIVAVYFLNINFKRENKQKYPVTCNRGNSAQHIYFSLVLPCSVDSFESD